MNETNIQKLHDWLERLSLWVAAMETRFADKGGFDDLDERLTRLESKFRDESEFNSVRYRKLNDFQACDQHEDRDGAVFWHPLMLLPEQAEVEGSACKSD